MPEKFSLLSEHPTLALIHVNVWPKPLQYYKVISLQLMKINGKKKKSRFTPRHASSLQIHTSFMSFCRCQLPTSQVVEQTQCPPTSDGSHWAVSTEEHERQVPHTCILLKSGSKKCFLCENIRSSLPCTVLIQTITTPCLAFQPDTGWCRCYDSRTVGEKGLLTAQGS